MVAKTSWVFKKSIFLSLFKIRGLIRGLQVSAGASADLALSLPYISISYCSCLCLEEDCMQRKKQIKNKMLWSMHDLLRFICSRAHMMVAHILAVWGLMSLFASIRSPSTVPSECYGRACLWQTPVQCHYPRPGR